MSDLKMYINNYLTIPPSNFCYQTHGIWKKADKKRLYNFSVKKRFSLAFVRKILIIDVLPLVVNIAKIFYYSSSIFVRILFVLWCFFFGNLLDIGILSEGPPLGDMGFFWILGFGNWDFLSNRNPIFCFFL
jgi:hypothetical protein